MPAPDSSGTPLQLTLPFSQSKRSLCSLIKKHGVVFETERPGEPVSSTEYLGHKVSYKPVQAPIGRSGLRKINEQPDPTGPETFFSISNRPFMDHGAF